MRDNVDWKFAISLPMIIFAFPVSRVFLLQPTGVTLGESFAIGFFLGGILLTLCSVRRGYIRYAAYAGFCFALSAYSRSQFEIILLALTGWGILLVIVVLLSRSKVVIEPKFSTSVVRTIVVALLVAHAATLPWRIYHLIYQGSPQWVSTSSLTFRNSVSTSEELEKVGAGWVVAGGGNLTCRIDPTTCGDTANAKHLFVKTFFTHPLEWYSRKFEVIGSYWFSSVQNWSGVGVGPTLMDFTTNALLLVVLAAIIFYLWLRKMRNHSSWILLVWFNVSLLSAYFLIFTFAHFEVRYFYFPKISIITMFLVLSGLYFSRQEKHPGRSHSGSAQFP
jgi:hypothetical protein